MKQVKNQLCLSCNSKNIKYVKYDFHNFKKVNYKFLIKFLLKLFNKFLPKQIGISYIDRALKFAKSPFGGRVKICHECGFGEMLDKPT